MNKKIKVLLSVIVVLVLVGIVTIPSFFNGDDKISQNENGNEIENELVIEEIEKGKMKDIVKKEKGFSFDDRVLQIDEPEKDVVEVDKKEDVESVEEKTEQEDVNTKDENKVVVKSENESNTKTGTEKSNDNNKNKETKKEEKPKNENKKETQPKQPVVTTKNVTETESISYKTVEEKDNTLEKGKTKVVQEGKKGVKTLTYKETYKDGKLVDRELISSKITQNPVNKIVKVGTKEETKPQPPSQPDFETIKSIYQANGYTVSGNVNDFVVSKNGQNVQTYSGNTFGIWDLTDYDFNLNHTAINTASKVLVILGVPLSESQIKQNLINVVDNGNTSVNGVEFSVGAVNYWVRW